jgi:anti-sigma B factor antagonist
MTDAERHPRETRDAWKARILSRRHRPAVRRQAPVRPFSVTTSADEQRLHTVVAGEVDIVTAPRLREALQVRTGVDDVSWLLDLSAVNFMDSTGLAVILSAHADMAARGGRLAIICPNGPVRLLFEVAGVVDELPLYLDRPTAVEALCLTPAPPRTRRASDRAS